MTSALLRNPPDITASTSPRAASNAPPAERQRRGSPGAAEPNAACTRESSSGRQTPADEECEAALSRGPALLSSHAQHRAPGVRTGSSAQARPSPPRRHAGARNRPDPSVCGLGSARLLLFSGPVAPGYCKSDTAMARIILPRLDTHSRGDRALLTQIQESARCDRRRLRRPGGIAGRPRGPCVAQPRECVTAAVGSRR
jgi:hypothetical protein